MNGSVIAILVLLTFGIAVSAVCHATIRPFFGASIASVLISTVLFQFAAYIALGYLDPFFLIAIVYGAFYACSSPFPLDSSHEPSVRTRLRLPRLPTSRAITPMTLTKSPTRNEAANHALQAFNQVIKAGGGVPHRSC